MFQWNNHRFPLRFNNEWDFTHIHIHVCIYSIYMELPAGYLSHQIKTWVIKNSVLSMQNHRIEINKQNFKCCIKHASPSRQHCLMSRDSDIKSNYKHHRKCEISSFSNHSRGQERLVSVCVEVCSNNEVINTQSTLLKVRI